LQGGLESERGTGPVKITSSPPASGAPVAYSRGSSVSVVSPECSLKDNVLYCGAQKVATYSTTCYYFDDHKGLSTPKRAGLGLPCSAI